MTRLENIANAIGRPAPARKTSGPIVAWSPEGVRHEFASVTEMARAVGSHHSTVSKSLANGWRVKGYSFTGPPLRIVVNGAAYPSKRAAIGAVRRAR